MFKYGSLKMFLIKILFGSISTGFAIIYIGSLLTYSQNDPGLNMFKDSYEDLDIKNYF